MKRIQLQITRMFKTLGFDTSNYTTSTALFDSKSFEVVQSKKLLPVKDGELGLRQSDALFHHTSRLFDIFSGLSFDKEQICAIGVSVRPRNLEGSYMPCFLAGQTVAKCIAKSLGVDVFETSHQVGHILAALYSANKLELKNDKFFAFHISGGTTDLLLCEPDENEVIKCTQIASSLDLKAGQAVDRVGLMLSLSFPCGVELEKLAGKSTASFKIKPTMKGMDCCLSGVENRCRKMLDEGMCAEDVAMFCLMSIYESIAQMTRVAISEYGKLPVVFAGGVMSNKIISARLSAEFDSYFASPEFSCDNAAGVSIFAAIKKGLI